MQVTVDIPDQYAQALTIEGETMARAVLEQAVAEAFRSGRLTTTEQVRVLLGFGTRMQAISFLGEHEIEIYTAESFKEDMATLDELFTDRWRRRQVVK